MILENNLIEHLKPEEKQLLYNLTIPVGAILTASKITGLHHQTIRNIRKLGYAKPETIKTLRKKLLSKYKAKATA